MHHLLGLKLLELKSCEGLKFIPNITLENMTSLMQLDLLGY